MAGDFDSKVMVDMLEETLGAWQVSSDIAKGEIPDMQPELPRGPRQLYLIDRPGATQVGQKF